MNTAQPIRSIEDLVQLKEYYQKISPNPRNYLLLVIGLNTALRISDILGLRWVDVYDFKKEQIRKHLRLTEQKTGKQSCILLNVSISEALSAYKLQLTQAGEHITENKYLFENRNVQHNPISRVQAFRIVKRAAEYAQISGVISCHSLRKTFGYYAWKQGVSPVLLMNIYNHSSFQVTKRYLGIEQDDRDLIFRTINL